ncbi:hypothetical protein K3723_01040 [Leisingera caerulea]|uniref:hypothetical protein n=1 Tax=Leisingera caerulea TaxID=506591 RepID=UPI0021A57F5B|nr:hypothetical protein [Leisingera caerulea]UWQ62918.1 hypothetical protein K3723_01040 [Leisingera caerulea]
MDLSRPNATKVQELISAHRTGKAEVAFVAVSASERQPGDRYLDSFCEFEARLKKLNVDDIPLLLGIAYFDISYWDNAVFADEECDLEERIHNVLFPTVAFSYSDFKRLTPEATGDILTDKKWRNRWCDRQMMWAHVSNERDIFVSSDKNFKKIERAAGFESVKVRSPKEAVKLL